MSTSPESRLFGAFWSDGTLDLVAGGAIVLIGVGYLLDGLPIGGFPVEAIVVPMALVVWMALHKWVVAPRAGYVEFSRRRRQRSTRELAWATVLGACILALVAAVAFWLRGGTAAIGESVAALPALLVALAALVAAGLTRAMRFVVYAGALTAAALGTLAIHDGPAFPLIAGGLVVWSTGAVLLGRFLAESRRFDEAS